MKRLFLSAALLGASLIASSAARSQPPGAPDGAPAAAASAIPSFTNDEVGVVEKLGQRVPLDLVFQDEDGKPVTLAGIVDKPTLLTLNYFRCAGICSPLLNGIAEVANRTNAVPGKDFQVLTVSFDDRDTPEIAARKRANYLQQMTRPFPPGAWRFLTGESAASKALATAVGFNWKRVGDDFVHAGVAIFLSPTGVVTRYLYGTTFLPADIELAASEAARGEARPSITKWLKFCFNYDPEGRRYVVNFTRVGATITISLAAVFALILVVKGRKTTRDPKEGA